MDITLQYFDGCPNWKTTQAHLSTLAAEGLDFTVHPQPITNHEAAVDAGFRGSPTVLVDGIDPLADKDTPVGLACRIYRTENQIAGSPSLSQLRTVISAAGTR